MTPRQTMNGKPCVERIAKSVINFNSGFREKGLCDGPTFSCGDACAYSCSFCYVEPMMMRNGAVNAACAETGRRFGNLVVRRRNPVEVVRRQLTDAKGRPKFNDPDDTRVIYASPLVDVAANIDLVCETIEVCLVVLELTNWHIRLLSKSTLLPKIADGISSRHKHRMIYGVSTGTFEDGLARSFEQGTPPPSKRIESLHRLQDSGHRTFGMVCPSLPLADAVDYSAFAEEAAERLRYGHPTMEHVWAEVLNVRGESMRRTVAALKAGGFTDEAEQVESVSANPEAWERYARSTFEAHARIVPTGKLRFLQYVTHKTRDWWNERRAHGAVPLGKAAQIPSLATAGDPAEKEIFEQPDREKIKC